MKKKAGNNVKGLGGNAAREIAYIALSVALICACTFITVPVGVIPFTLQTFAVALVGLVMGWKRGIASIGVYVLMGLVGIPVFSGFRAGIAVLFGATGGYILGFFFSVTVTALARYLPVRNRAGRLALFYLASILGMAVCYFFGTAWFCIVFRCEVSCALSVCVLPYLLPDAVKLFVAAFIGVRLEKSVR